MTVGRVGRPHGVRGEVTVLPETDDPERFAAGAVLGTDSGELVVTSSKRYRDKGLVVGFEGVTDRAGAEALRGTVLTVETDRRRELDDGEFWPEDLIGLEAKAPDGSPLGTVTGVDQGVAQSRLVVTTTDGREVLVPFVSELVDDPTDGTIEIRDPGGLF